MDSTKRLQKFLGLPTFDYSLEGHLTLGILNVLTEEQWAKKCSQKWAE